MTKYATFSIITCAAALYTTACNGPEPEKTKATPSSMTTSVVQVRTGHGRGTGFVIQSAGRLLIATAAHVIADTSDVMILREQPIGGTEVFRTIYPDVRFVAVDFERDIALLEIPNLPNGTLTPLSLDGVRCDTAVTGYGYPPTVFTSTHEQGLTPTALTGIKRVQLDAEERLGGRSRTLTRGSVEGIVFTPALEPGNSGGPILSATGDVVAITVMKSMLHAQGAAVCAKHLEEMIPSSSKDPVVTGAEAARFVTDVVNGFLPFADDKDSSRAARDFILPSIIERAKGTYRQFIGLYFAAATSNQTRARALKRRLRQRFQELARVLRRLANSA